MCWEGKVEDKKTATEDVIVYKVLLKGTHNDNTMYVAPYRKEYGYTLGILEEIPEFVFDEHRKQTLGIKEGFNSFSEDSYVLQYEKYGGYNNVMFVSPYDVDDFYGHVGEFTFYPWDCVNDDDETKVIHFEPVIVRCIIPKGTEYYENEYGHIVSTKLIVKEEVTNVPMTPNKSLRFKDINV